MVKLADYPEQEVAYVYYPFEIQYREFIPPEPEEEEEQEESGFSVNPFAPDLSLDDIVLDGYKTTFF